MCGKRLFWRPVQLRAAAIIVSVSNQYSGAEKRTSKATVADRLGGWLFPSSSSFPFHLSPPPYRIRHSFLGSPKIMIHLLLPFPTPEEKEEDEEEKTLTFLNSLFGIITPQGSLCVCLSWRRGSKYGLRLTDGGQFGPGERRRGESKRSTSSSRERSAVDYMYSTAMELPPIFALGGRLLLNEKVVSCQINSIHTVWSLVLARPKMLDC